jgi:hypothetical protein
VRNLVITPIPSRKLKKNLSTNTVKERQSLY